jgi:hypothetical protein
MDQWKLTTADTGDGFGGAGPGGKRISVDAEGLVLGDKDTFWVSDEYGEMPLRYLEWKYDSL